MFYVSNTFYYHLIMIFVQKYINAKHRQKTNGFRVITPISRCHFGYKFIGVLYITISFSISCSKSIFTF